MTTLFFKYRLLFFLDRNTARRRRYRRASSETSVQSEDYSIVDHPSEYPAGMIPGDGPQCGKGRLLGGIVDGVPYFEEAKEMCESPQVKPEDLAMEAEMKLCSLNQR